MVINIIQTKKGDYIIDGSNKVDIGVQTGGDLPLHFPNPKAHRRFLENIFETSPYSLFLK